LAPQRFDGSQSPPSWVIRRQPSGVQMSPALHERSSLHDCPTSALAAQVPQAPLRSQNRLEQSASTAHRSPFGSAPGGCQHSVAMVPPRNAWQNGAPMAASQRLAMIGVPAD
jgi:hypothetical protein